LEPLVLPRLAALLLILAAVPVQAQSNPDAEEGDAPQGSPADGAADPAPRPEDYEGALQPFGTWRDMPTYGRFWRPSVAAGWRPYLDGQWVWTAYGWTWLSTEPWGWTLHYGRWSYLPRFGWAWFPGSVWGPAWVRWVWYGDYVGWAPLSPFAGAVVNDFAFVRGRDFCSPRLRRYVIRRDRVPAGIRDNWRSHVDRIPDRQWVERESGRPVHTVGDRPAHTLAPWERRGPRAERPPTRPERPPTRADRDAAPQRPRPERRWLLRPDRDASAPRERPGGDRAPRTERADRPAPRRFFWLQSDRQDGNRGALRPRDRAPLARERGPGAPEHARPVHPAPATPPGHGLLDAPRGRSPDAGHGPAAARGGFAIGR
jgi:hypothetical protein